MINSSFPKVSIIVPVYKVEKYINKCIESIIYQTYKNWELILIDDGSPDRSGEICDEYAEIDGRVHVIHKSNEGQSAARNDGLDVISSDYVTFLDSDDFWHPDYLKDMMSLMLCYNADIVQCKYVWGYDNVFPNVSNKEFIRIVTGKEALYMDICNVLVWGKVYKASLFEGIRMPVGIHNEDDCTTWKICYRANKLVYTSKCLVYYTLNNEGLTAQGTRKLDLSYYRAYREKLEIFKRDDEQELLRWTLWKWNKSILLNYGNDYATKDQQKMIMRNFKDNQQQLKKLSPLPFFWRLIFFMFEISPLVLSKITLRLKDIIRYRTYRRFSKN